MTKEELSQLLEKHDYTYEQFAAHLNAFCGRTIVSEARAKQSVSDWLSGRRGIHPATQFAIEQFFQTKRP